MIQVNELRLGNLVRSSKYHNGLETEIFAVQSHNSIRLGCNPMPNYEVEDIDAIEITEEWLLKLGFIYKLGGWRKGKLRLSDNLEVPVYYTHYNGAFLKTIQYVHELQNLYFALTNEELTLK